MEAGEEFGSLNCFSCSGRVQPHELGMLGLGLAGRGTVNDTVLAQLVVLAFETTIKKIMA